VQQQLQKAKLPLMVQTVGTNKGDRIRVRTGPFATASKARAAARKAQQLGLEAVVFQHP
jgi:cell division septation protein DedD